MNQNELQIHIRSNPVRYNLAVQTFGAPFQWLLEILNNMTGYSHPSGYAIIGSNHIVKKIWVGNTNEYALWKELQYINRCIYIDNFEGPERATYGWKGLSQKDIEETFGINFNNIKIASFGGFPSHLALTY